MKEIETWLRMTTNNGQKPEQVESTTKTKVSYEKASYQSLDHRN